MMPVEIASKVLRTVHETAADLLEIGAIDKTTMREFDLLRLSPAKERTPKGDPRAAAAQPGQPAGLRGVPGCREGGGAAVGAGP